jgi:hypothetical protein
MEASSVFEQRPKEKFDASLVRLGETSRRPYL